MGQPVLNEDLAINLLEFAERYLIDELKMSCENYLASILTVNNCLKIFETAGFYEATSLKKRVLQFLASHLKEITESKDFENLPKLTYIFFKRIQWNEKLIFDNSFAESMII